MFNVIDGRGHSLLESSTDVLDLLVLSKRALGTPKWGEKEERTEKGVRGEDCHTEELALTSLKFHYVPPQNWKLG